MNLNPDLRTLFPPSMAPSRSNNTKLAKLKKHLIEEGEYLISHMLEGRMADKPGSLNDFEREWARFEERHEDQKSPSERLLETASGLSLLYSFSELTPGGGLARLDYSTSALVDEFVRRAAACSPNPIPQRSLARLLASAVHVRLPSWSAERVVRLWRDVQFTPEEMFPHAIRWAKAKDDVEVGAVARNAIMEFCVALLKQVLQDSSRCDAKYYAGWSSNLKLLSQDYQNLATGELE